jgi:aminoglycoside 3-N-acetyltransferase
MVSYHDLMHGFRQLEISPDKPVIIHTSLSSFGEIHGGAATLLGALLAGFNSLFAPAFTYKTMLIPEDGPENNGLTYGSGRDSNRLAEFFQPDMPIDPLIGRFPAEILSYPKAFRSTHPIYSFVGVATDDLLQTQSIPNPLAPIFQLAERGGWVLLLGVDHTANTSLHAAERLAGRAGFIRWALTTEGVIECPGIGGCSNGFEKAAPLLAPITRQVTIGQAQIRALPVAPMLELFSAAIKKDPIAFLCDDITCQCCEAVRSAARSGQVV